MHDRKGESSSTLRTERESQEEKKGIKRIQKLEGSSVKLRAIQKKYKEKGDLPSPVCLMTAVAVHR